ncbi:MAG TPA: DUF1294 domain-containing protein [Nitrososphaerales archaeon]|nr:DUF1294 domain-containing protein [Nitrososphaerales archaeon]
MSPVWGLAAGWLALLGVVGFALMGFDKHLARGAGSRISERTFFGLAFVGGVFGVLVGSIVFHHKTRKGSFMVVVLLSALVWLVVVSELGRLVGFP